MQKSSKMVKKSKNPDKSLKFNTKKNKIKKKIVFAKIKKNAILLVFQYKMGAIRPELSSPAHFRNMKISKNPKNSLFSFFFVFFEEKFFCQKRKEKKCYPLSFPILGGRNSTRALQSTLFQNPGGVP